MADDRDDRVVGNVAGGEPEQARPSAALPPAAEGPPLLEVVGLAKTFGSVHALKGVDIKVRAGEIHALLGANGAGKSTLIRALAGGVRPDSGEILFDGSPVVIRNPLQSSDLGISVLHQELSLVPKFSTLQNMGLGLLRRGRFGFADTRAVRRHATAVAQQLEIKFDLRRPVNELSVAEQWLVALGTALMRRARLICLDEPTASLSARETEVLFKIVEQLSAQGIAIIYVSHRLEEVERLCHRATVFRDGLVVADLDRHELNRERLIAAITGGIAGAVAVVAARTSPPGPVVLEASGLTRSSVVRDVSLTLHSREVLGIAGLVGAGRSELARLLFGADRREAGEIRLDGKLLPAYGPAEASKWGIGLVPEERRSQGLVMPKSAAFNMNLTFTAGQRIWRKAPLISGARARARAVEAAASVELQAARVTSPVRELSGGNQQKVVLGRWLLGDIKVLIMDEPTRGIDVGSRAALHRLIRQFANDGLGVIVISSDFEELLGCDRVLVMARGQIVEELTGPAITEERMLRAAYETPSDLVHA